MPDELTVIISRIFLSLHGTTFCGKQLRIFVTNTIYHLGRASKPALRRWWGPADAGRTVDMRPRKVARNATRGCNHGQRQSFF